jgi:hypothetical protein
MIYTLLLFAVLFGLFVIITKGVYRGKAVANPESGSERLEQRVNWYKNEIFINNDPLARNIDIEITPVIELKGKVPEIIIYEGSTKICTYKIEKKHGGINPDGAFLHASVRVNANSSVQIDGLLSKDPRKYDCANDEGIRFQPFFLSDRKEANDALKGQGAFARGLHYPGYISSGDMRLICVCDVCNDSFSLDFIHAGFSEVQYFYSEHSKEVIFVRYRDIPNMPLQLHKEIDEKLLAEVESELPVSNDGAFKFYNGLKCPHCNSMYIDFKRHKNLRSVEYYAHYHLNTEPKYYTK